MKPTMRIVLAVIATAAISLWAGYRWGQPPASETAGSGDDSGAAVSEPTSAEPEVLYWYDPMVPDQHFDKPGKSPFMDMDLVPRYADSASSASISIAAGIQQNLGIRTARVELTSVPERIRVPGSLSWNLRDEVRISARVESLVQEVNVRTPFQPVRRGEVLASLLAPGLASAVAEYQALIGAESATGRELAAAAEQRLRLLGIDPHDVSAQRPGRPPRILLRAPRDALASEVLLREGDTVMPGQALFRLNGSDSLWLELRVPQAQAAALQAGDAAEVRVDGQPGQLFSASIEAVLPEVEPRTRTQGVRLLLANPQGRLAAGQFAEAELQLENSRRCPWIPSEALILTGRAARVILRDKDGEFEPREVATGRQVGERVEILDGLSGGEEVVISGQFLIDSEASLSGLLARLNQASQSAPSGDQP